MDLVMQVVEGEDAVEKHQDAVGNLEIVFGAVSDVFQATHDVVGAIANGSGRKRRQAFDRGGAVLAQEFLDGLEGVSGAGFLFAATLDRDFGSAGLEAEEG